MIRQLVLQRLLQAQAEQEARQAALLLDSSTNGDDGNEAFRRTASVLPPATMPPATAAAVPLARTTTSSSSLVRPENQATKDDDWEEEESPEESPARRRTSSSLSAAASDSINIALFNNSNNKKIVESQDWQNDDEDDDDSGEEEEDSHSSEEEDFPHRAAVAATTSPSMSSTYRSLPPSTSGAHAQTTTTLVSVQTIMAKNAILAEDQNNWQDDDDDEEEELSSAEEESRDWEEAFPSQRRRVPPPATALPFVPQTNLAVSGRDNNNINKNDKDRDWQDDEKKANDQNWQDDEEDSGEEEEANPDWEDEEREEASFNSEEEEDSDDAIMDVLPRGRSSTEKNTTPATPAIDDDDESDLEDHLAVGDDNPLPQKTNDPSILSPPPPPPARRSSYSSLPSTAPSRSSSGGGGEYRKKRAKADDSDWEDDGEQEEEESLEEWEEEQDGVVNDSDDVDVITDISSSRSLQDRALQEGNHQAAGIAPSPTVAIISRRENSLPVPPRPLSELPPPAGTGAYTSYPSSLVEAAAPTNLQYKKKMQRPSPARTNIGRKRKEAVIDEDEDWLSEEEEEEDDTFDWEEEEDSDTRTNLTSSKSDLQSNDVIVVDDDSTMEDNVKRMLAPRRASKTAKKRIARQASNTSPLPLLVPAQKRPTKKQRKSVSVLPQPPSGSQPNKPVADRGHRKPKDILYSATDLTYSWDSLLQLGSSSAASKHTMMGSGALNTFLQQNGAPSRLTTRQVLDIVTHMRPKALLPPEESPLHEVMHQKNHKYKVEHFQDEILEDEEEEETAEGVAFQQEADKDAMVLTGESTKDPPESLKLAPASVASEQQGATAGKQAPPMEKQVAQTTVKKAPPSEVQATERPTEQGSAGQTIEPTKETETSSRWKLPINKLSILYDTMCDQELDDGTFHRREMQYLSAPMLVEKLKSLENRFCALKAREDSAMCEGRRLGLVDPKLMYSLMGYRDPMVENSAKRKVAS